MKKFKLILMIAVAFMFAIASCQKNDDLFVNGNENETESISRNKDFRGDDDQINVNDPDPVLMAHLDSLYGDIFYINNDSIKMANLYYYHGTLTVKLWAFPFKLMKGFYLTVVHISNTQILGLYVIEYYNLQNDGTDSFTYEFEVYDPDTFAPNLFTGHATTNIFPYTPDYLSIYNNSINIPTDYPDPLFDNITSGNVGLQSVVNLGSFDTLGKITLRIAGTFYVNYCGS